LSWCSFFPLHRGYVLWLYDSVSGRFKKKEIAIVGSLLATNLIDYFVLLKEEFSTESSGSREQFNALSAFFVCIFACWAGVERVW
jgi:hypothetical protein